MKNNTIKILSHNLEMIVDDPHEWSDNGLGRIDLRSMIIRLSDKTSPEIQKSTLIHEITHFIFDINGIEDVSESVVNAIALGFFSFIRDNPEIIKQLQYKETMKEGIDGADT